MIFQKYKKWIFILAGLLVAFILYSVLAGGGSSQGSEPLLTSTAQQTPAEVVGAEIINALNQIESLTLDRSILTDPVYQSLQDRSQPIPPEPVGKANPFDPIGSSAPESAAPQIEDEERVPATTENRGPSTIINQPSSGDPPVI